MITKNEEKVLGKLIDSNNWRPNFSKIAKKTNIPVSTVWDVYKRVQKDKTLLINCEVSIVFDKDKQVIQNDKNRN